MLFNKTNTKASIELLRFLLVLALIWENLSAYYKGTGVVALLHPSYLTICFPCFFMLSGFFAIEKETNTIYKSIIKTILYILLGFMIYSALYLAKIIPVNPLSMIFGAQFLNDGLLTWWFSFIMIAITFASPLIKKVIKSLKKGISIGGIIFMWFFVVFASIQLNSTEKLNYYTMYNIQFFFIGVTFYSIGCWIKLHMIPCVSKRKITTVTISTIVFAIYTLFCIFEPSITGYLHKKSIVIDAINPMVSEIALLNVFGSMALIMIFYFLSFNNSKIKWLNFFFIELGKISLPMYLFRGCIMQAVFLYLPQYKNDWNTEFFMIIAIAMTFASAVYIPMNLCNYYVCKAFEKKYVNKN